MPELRKDPLSDGWVIIATERGRRPSEFEAVCTPRKIDYCPFCEGHESVTPPEILAFREPGTRPNGPGWQVRVVPNKFPALQVEGNLNKRGEGIYDRMRGVGAHEVIVEAPGHETSLTVLPDERVREVLRAYRERMADLKRDKRLVYTIIFKNVGMTAGATLDHTHSQLIATPIVPLQTLREIHCGERWFGYRGRCIFCDMIEQELDTKTRIVAQNEEFVAFEPFAPKVPFETWIFPKSHWTHFENAEDRQLIRLAEVLKAMLKKIETGLHMPPYNFVLHSAPFDVGDPPYYHWHIEIMPRITAVAGFEWGSGFHINPVPPEDAAEFLREVE